jgi:hypothetical protein
VSLIDRSAELRSNLTTSSAALSVEWLTI